LEIQILSIFLDISKEIEGCKICSKGVFNGRTAFREKLNEKAENRDLEKI